MWKVVEIKTELMGHQASKNRIRGKLDAVNFQERLNIERLLYATALVCFCLYWMCSLENRLQIYRSNNFVVSCNKCIHIHHKKVLTHTHAQAHTHTHTYIYIYIYRYIYI